MSAVQNNGYLMAFWTVLVVALLFLIVLPLLADFFGPKKPAPSQGEMTLGQALIQIFGTGERRRFGLRAGTYIAPIYEMELTEEDRRAIRVLVEGGRYGYDSRPLRSREAVAPGWEDTASRPEDEGRLEAGRG